jgi:hypothetical protein
MSRWSTLDARQSLSSSIWKFELEQQSSRAVIKRTTRWKLATELLELCSRNTNNIPIIRNIYSCKSCPDNNNFRPPSNFISIFFVRSKTMEHDRKRPLEAKQKQGCVESRRWFWLPAQQQERERGASIFVFFLCLEGRKMNKIERGKLKTNKQKGRAWTGKELKGRNTISVRVCVWTCPEMVIWKWAGRQCLVCSSIWCHVQTHESVNALVTFACMYIWMCCGPTSAAFRRNWRPTPWTENAFDRQLHSTLPNRPLHPIPWTP